MDTNKLIDLYHQARSFEVTKADSMPMKLTNKIAKSCESSKEFIGAITEHNYPPISLTQVEAEFLRAGGLSLELDNHISIFKRS